jgi:quercetin dioxygenase-like cupin family protein
MIRLFCFCILVPVIVGGNLAAQSTNEVEITSEPAHHLAIENDYVRVFQVEVPPHQSTLLHRHRHDYIFVTLGATEISNEVEGKQAAQVKLADGETRFTEGNFAHVARNLSDQPFRNVTIEFMQDGQMRSAASQWADDVSEETLPGGHRKTLFVKDGARVSSVELEPGGRLPGEKFVRPTLIVGTTYGQLSNGRTHREELTPGGLLWSYGKSPSSLEKTNVGTKPARFVMIEFW